MPGTRTLLHVKGAYDIAGGPETLVRHIMQSIDPRRFEQRVVIFENQAGKGCAALREPTQHGPPLTEKWRGLTLAPWSARRLAKIATLTNADLVHTHDMRTNLAACLMTRMSRVPWIASIHGWLGETHTRRWQWYERIEGHLIRQAKAVMVGSRSSQREVEAFGARNVHVIHHGIVAQDSTRWKAEAQQLRSGIGAGPNTVVIGVVTRIHPGKGVRQLVAALIELLRRGLDVIGVIAGVGPERDSILRELESAGLTHKIRMPGYIEDANLWMTAMDIIALPTLKDSFPFSVIDAVAMGKPVVTTTVGDLPLAVIDGTNGFLVPPGEVPLLAAALERLVQDPGMRARFGSRGRKLIQDQFSPAAMTGKLEAMYLSVLQN